MSFFVQAALERLSLSDSPSTPPVPPAPAPNDEQLDRQQIDRLTLALSLATTKLAYTRRQLRFCRWRQFRARTAHFYAIEADRLRRLVRLSVEYLPVGILMTSALAGATGYFVSSSWIVGVLAMCAAALLVTALLYLPDDDELMPWVGRIRARLVKVEAQRVRLSLKQRVTAKQLTALSEERELLLAVIADRKLRASRLFRRKQLLAKDWKSLRSVPLAGYLEEVFRELDYTIEPTSSADTCGPNLIVAKAGHKLAIHVIGFVDTVSDSAIQAAATAQEERQCEGCAVITNSRFSLAAQERAGELRCVLVDENFLPALVLGHFDLWDHQCSLQINAELVRERNSPQGKPDAA